MTLSRITLTGLAAGAALVAATAASAAKPQPAPGPLAGAVHEAYQGTTAKGASLTRVLDRGRVAAVSAGSLTVAEPGGASYTFILDAQTRVLGGVIQVGDRVAVSSDGSKALAIRVRHGLRGAARGQSLRLLAGFVHATVDTTSRTGAHSTFVYDRGQITSLSGGTVAVKRRDGASVSLTFDGTTTVREKGKPESVSDLEVGERAMFFSDASGHVFLVRCVSKARTGSS